MKRLGEARRAFLDSHASRPRADGKRTGAAVGTPLLRATGLPSLWRTTPHPGFGHLPQQKAGE